MNVPERIVHGFKNTVGEAARLAAAPGIAEPARFTP